MAVYAPISWMAEVVGKARPLILHHQVGIEHVIPPIRQGDRHHAKRGLTVWPLQVQRHHTRSPLHLLHAPDFLLCGEGILHVASCLHHRLIGHKARESNHTYLQG